MTATPRSTIQSLLVELGGACSEYQDKVFRNLNLQRIQCDEIWQFVGCKEKNASVKQKRKGWGDVWTWTALDAETKLVPCWYVGERGTPTTSKDLPRYGARVYKLEGKLLVKQTVLRGVPPEYVIDEQRERHVNEKDDSAVAEVIRDAVNGRL